MGRREGGGRKGGGWREGECEKATSIQVC